MFLMRLMHLTSFKLKNGSDDFQKLIEKNIEEKKLNLILKMKQSTKLRILLKIKNKT